MNTEKSEQGIHMNVNNTAASATVNMNMTSTDGGIYCRKVL